MFNKDAYEDFLLDNKFPGFFDPFIILKSGRPGHWYINMREALLNRDLLRTLAKYMYDFCMDIGVKPDYFLGVPEGATPLAEEMNRLIDYKEPKLVRASILRSGAKAHGAPQDRNSVGGVYPGDHVALIEDITTTGSSSGPYILRLQEIGVWIDTLVSCASRYEKKDRGRTPEDVVLRDYNIPIFAAATDARTLLPKAVERFNPPQFIRDEIEKYYKQYGIEEIKLPKAA
jgi:orotate phosphoribosyltransferase